MYCSGIFCFHFEKEIFIDTDFQNEDKFLVSFVLKRIIAYKKA